MFVVTLLRTIKFIKSMIKTNRLKGACRKPGHFSFFKFIPSVQDSPNQLLNNETDKVYNAFHVYRDITPLRCKLSLKSITTNVRCLLDMNRRNGRCIHDLATNYLYRAAIATQIRFVTRNICHTKRISDSREKRDSSRD